jgi:hypothetical protein
MRHLCSFLVALLAASLCFGQALVLPDNMKVLNCDPPSADFKFTKSSALGQLFYPGETVDLEFVFKKVDGIGPAYAIELQEITTRDPEARSKSMAGFTDTAGHAAIIATYGDPIVHKLDVKFDDAGVATVAVKNLPLPERFGTYAMVLTSGEKRVYLGSLARVPARREDGTVENTPVFGEGQFLHGPPEAVDRNVGIYSRMGIRGWRSELSWSETLDGDLRLGVYEALFASAKKYGMKIMVTLGGHPPHFRPFNVPTPAAHWRPNTGGYGGTGDWLCHPEFYPRYEKWVEEFCRYYWEDGKGGLWGLENYNEPWEGGGISGWARDMVQYREVQRLIARAARRVSPDIRILAASSIMNTEDKLYSDGSNEFDEYLDIFTDHYVVPSMCYGPLVAKAHGKESMETETWVVSTEYMLPNVVAQFMAAGQARIAPWHPRVLYDVVGDQPCPAPVVVATTVFNHFCTGKKFDKIVFRDHLPWVFQYGDDSDTDATLVMFGQLLNAFGNDPKERPFAQVEAVAGGTITIDNSDGLLKFFDLAGNPVHEGEAQVTLPMSFLPYYIKSAEGPVKAAERIKAAKVAGKRPVEILPIDFTEAVAPGAVLRVKLHNCLPQAISGTLAVTAPDGLKLESAEQAVELAGGETKTLEFRLAEAKAVPANSYPFSFKFASEAGDAEYAENLNSVVVKKKTIVVDGKLDDWNDIPGITVVAGVQAVDLAEKMRRPWLDLKEETPQGNLGEFKLAWDENYLYIMARYNDPTADDKKPLFSAVPEDHYFHSAASDQVEPYKTFIENFRKEHPNAKYKSFADVPFVWRSSPEQFIPFRRDRLHIALDVTDGWHDLENNWDRVTPKFSAYPDTDYEYSLYMGVDGEGNPANELWRHLAPGVPRIHDFPRQVKGERTTGVVSGATSFVSREGSVYTYELAIPKEELADLKLEPGTTFGLMVRGGNSQGPHVDYGLDKSATKINGLSLHPYWERSVDCGVRWVLGE